MHLGVTYVGPHRGQYICKGKSDGVYLMNLKRAWEMLLQAAHAIVATANWPAGPYCWLLPSWDFAYRVQTASWELPLLVATDSRADPQPCLPLFCASLTLLCAMWILTIGARTTGFSEGCWLGRFCVCVATSPNSHGRSYLLSTASETREEIGKGEQAAADKAVPEKAFPSFRDSQIYCDSTPRSRSDLKGLLVPSCLSSVALLTTLAL